MLFQVRYLPTKANTDQALLRRLKGQILRDFGMYVDPFRLHACYPKLLAGVWAACRETELVGDTPRAAKELVAACVSDSNRCTYCVDAHTMLLNSTGETDISKQVVQKEFTDIRNPQLRAVANWARASREPHSPRLSEPRFPQQWRTELIGMAVFYHYLNRMVHVFLPEQLLPVRAAGPKQGMKRVAGWMFSFIVRRRLPSGKSLQQLPPVSVPDDFAWAQSQADLAQGFAQLAWITEQLAGEHIPAAVRAAHQSYLQTWWGEDAPLDNRWLEAARAPLPPEQHAMLDLMLLTSVAPYRVDQGRMAAFIAQHPAPLTLLSAAAWASFAGARRIGSWMARPQSADGTRRQA